MGLEPIAMVLHMEYNEDYQGYPRPGHPGYRWRRCPKCNEGYVCAWGVPEDAIQNCGSRECSDATPRS